MSLSENLHNLGTLLKTNLETKGITGLTGNEGLTTLANKIKDITCKAEEENALILTVKGDEITLGLNQLIWEDDIIIDWGDETTTTKSYPNNPITHEYSDGIEEHTIRVIGALTQIGYHAFYMDTNLTSIIIPSSVTEMGMNCFYGCSNLKKVVIPSSVTSMDECFLVCSNLVDYQLFWESSPILYNSRNMPNNTDTVFTIPVGTTQLYIDAGYPSAKLRERHEYELYVTKDKKIIQTNEDVTLIGMLMKDGEAAVGETLNYQVLHNGNVIDSGSGVTDGNGLAEITYTGTGVGDVDIVVEYGTLLQETYELEDCFRYNSLTSNDGLFSSSSGVSASYSSNGLTVLGNRTSDSYYLSTFNFPSSDFSIEYTLEGYVFNQHQCASDILMYGLFIEPHVNGFDFRSSSNIIVSSTTHLSQGDVIKFEIIGNTVKLYINDTYIDSGNKADNNCGFKTYNQRSITVKDMKIKPL